MTAAALESREPVIDEILRATDQVAEAFGPSHDYGADSPKGAALHRLFVASTALMPFAANRKPCPTRLVDTSLEPRDAALAQATIDLVAHGEFAGAMGLLRRHLADKARDRETETEREFLAWYDLPTERPAFWDWAHAERRRKDPSHDAEIETPPVF